MTKAKRMMAKILYLPIKAVLVLMESLKIFPEYTRAMRVIEQYGKGRRAYKAGHFAQAFQTFKQVAAIESASFAEVMVGYAQYYIGVMYYYGQGVTADSQIAEAYIRKAADHQVTEAVQFLGRKQ